MNSMCRWAGFPSTGYSPGWAVLGRDGQAPAARGHAEGPERDRFNASDQAKNTAELFSLFALANLVHTEDRILAQRVVALRARR